MHILDNPFIYPLAIAVLLLVVWLLDKWHDRWARKSARREAIELMDKQYGHDPRYKQWRKFK